MSKKYTVVSTGKLSLYESVDQHIMMAEKLRQDYGLTHLSTERVLRVWEGYSRKLGAGWVMPTPEMVENVFGVTLEEV
jgi:hypothetical protein